jgi:hypothetical protein
MQRIQKLYSNKTLYEALTRWGYTNTHITVHATSFPGLQCEDEARHEEALPVNFAF